MSSTRTVPAEALNEAILVATRAAQAAGAIIKNSIDSRVFCRAPGVACSGGLDIETKSSSADLVTQYDKQCEALVLEALRAFKPSGQSEPWAIMSEESLSDHELLNEPTWIVDPIDGTTSFVHGSFDCCVSIGLSVNRIPVLGVVFAPIVNELYTAVVGQGAYCNGRRIAASGCVDTGRASVITHAPYDRRPHVIDALLAMNKRFLCDLKVHCVRSYGSAAMDMCSVAIGRADCYLEVGICAWDMCAATIIVREAGGTVTDIYGGELDLTRRGMCCSATASLGATASQVAKECQYREAMMGSA